jgi:hypothetical protein
MGHVALGLIGLGVVIASLFEIRALLATVAGIFILSLGSAIYLHLGVLEIIIAIFSAQAIFQASYFIALVVLTAVARSLGNDPATAPRPDGSSTPVASIAFGIQNKTRR